jgi:hypothetical protein
MTNSHLLYRMSHECGSFRAVDLSPAVQEQLFVDACARTFALTDASAVDSVRRLLSAVDLETGICRTDLLDFVSGDYSMFSVDVLDELLAEASFSPVDEDEVLLRLLNLWGITPAPAADRNWIFQRGRRRDPG